MKQPFSKPLISFRKLHGGQFGTLDVSGLGQRYVQLALGSDFISLTRAQWTSLRCVVDRFFDCETDVVALTAENGEPVVFDREVTEVEEVEEAEEVRPAPHQTRNRSPRRRPAD